MWLPVVPAAIEHAHPHSSPQDRSQEEERSHNDIEPIIVKKLSLHEELAQEIKESGIDCEALPVGSHPIEGKPYYSQMLPLSSRLVTNRGLVKIRGKNIDFVHILQRN